MTDFHVPLNFCSTLSISFWLQYNRFSQSNFYIPWNRNSALLQYVLSNNKAGMFARQVQWWSVFDDKEFPFALDRLTEFEPFNNSPQISRWEGKLPFVSYIMCGMDSAGPWHVYSLICLHTGNNTNSILFCRCGLMAWGATGISISKLILLKYVYNVNCQ